MVLITLIHIKIKPGMKRLFWNRIKFISLWYYYKKYYKMLEKETTDIVILLMTPIIICYYFINCLFQKNFLEWITFFFASDFIQEIDGRAMLLMSRNDCLTGLRIKLGPALKIYHMHIHKLQKRTEFLGWSWLIIKSTFLAENFLYDTHLVYLL